MSEMKNKDKSQKDMPKFGGPKGPGGSADRIHILESMPVNKAIWKLGIPTMLAMLVQVIYNMTDTFFIGKLNDPNMVAAISICMPIAMIVQTFGNIFAIGGASLISRLIGAGERENANHAAAISFWAALSICTVSAMIGLIFIDPLLSIVGASANTMVYAKSYLTVVLLGGPFMGMQMAMGGLLRSEGATKESMVGMMTGSIINMVLDPIFILLLNFGIVGAALATTIGNMIGFTYYIFFYLKKKGIISISPKYFTLEKHYYANIFKIGIPASLGMVLMSVGMIISNIFAAGFGDVVIAANGIVMRVTSIAFMMVMGLAQGCQPLMGYSYGCKKYSRLFDTIKHAAISSSLIGTAFGIIFYVFAKGWIQVFMIDQQVVDLGVRVMRARALAMPIFGVQMILMTMFQSLGRSVESLIISLGRQGLFFIPSIIIFSTVWGLNGFIYAQPFADVFTTMLAVLLFFLMRKKLMAQTSEGAIDPIA